VDPTDAADIDRRHTRLVQELVVRGSVAVAVLAFDRVYDLASGGHGSRGVAAIAVGALLLNGFYYLAARTRRAPRLQAYLRMFIDILLVTLGLAAVGGVAAGQYLSIYAIIPIYAGLVLSSTACLVATGVSTLLYLAVAVYHHAAVSNLEVAWTAVAFNLLVLDIIGIMTAVLAHAYRASRTRLAETHRELERAHDETLALNAQIQRSARLRVLGEVVAGVAHELNNLLSVALGQTELVRRQGAGLPPAVLAGVGRIRQSCETAARIVQNALSTARQPADERVLLALSEIVTRMTELKRYDLRRHRIAIRSRFASDVPPVLGVPFQLQQVILNLVANAQQSLEGHPQPRDIEIVGFQDGGRVVIEVRDNGPGIAPAALPRLFEPFYTTKPDGTGLGLAISSTIVREHGGELTADNLAGGGAVFRVSLPAAKAAAPYGRPVSG
jgi:signal transduction histidine kinase